MGITIHWRLEQQKINIKKTLNRTQELAESFKREQASKTGIPFSIRRENDYALFIDIGGCETLGIHFYSKKEIEERAKQGWDYLHATLTDDGKKPLDNGYMVEKYPQNEIYFASGFCKTQFAKSILEHYWVAELLRSVASYCKNAYVSDEGDYYHSGQLENAKENIESLGKMIDGLGAKLADAFGAENIIKGGDTVIKKNK